LSPAALVTNRFHHCEPIEPSTEGQHRQKRPHPPRPPVFRGTNVHSIDQRELADAGRRVSVKFLQAQDYHFNESLLSHGAAE
jgi:hypothetical protein